MAGPAVPLRIALHAMRAYTAGAHSPSSFDELHPIVDRHVQIHYGSQISPVIVQSRPVKLALRAQ